MYAQGREGEGKVPVPCCPGERGQRSGPISTYLGLAGVIQRSSQPVSSHRSREVESRPPAEEENPMRFRDPASLPRRRRTGCIGVNAAPGTPGELVADRQDHSTAWITASALPTGFDLIIRPPSKFPCGPQRPFGTSVDHPCLKSSAGCEAWGNAAAAVRGRLNPSGADGLPASGP